ncbi:octopamine receptor 1-like isoform X2 [Cylas formicarius]|uniref:octopamine receptor 1-like isoform X2 n=1 Tax=Cylas formicarius TaxID=197179 RepID=UPI0029586D42|nr:octopamine receptor 1-like isoform X2 [Cylas formicarius]
MPSSSAESLLGTNDTSVVEPAHVTDLQKIGLVLLLSVVIVVVVVGNTLVILAVITTKRLRTVTNCFVMSLAVADWLVGIFVMPPAVAYNFKGAWELGWILCDLWISLDILLCTASILSLCAISIDRYLAVTQPLTYSRKRRSKRLAFIMILIVWSSSALITCPPMFGWYEPGRHEGNTCRYNKNTGYVIFSAMGSFFIPMVVMLYVYLRISCVIAQRHDQLSHMDTINPVKRKRGVLTTEESDIDRASSENEETHLKYASNDSPNILQGHKNSTANPTKKSIALTRSLKSDHFHQNVEPHNKGSILYRSPVSSRGRLEPHLHLDASVLNFEPASRVSSFRRESKTAQTLSVVMGGFIMCWLPFFVFYLLTPFITQNSVNLIVMQYFTWLGWINSAINPFIYAFYSPDFRIAFWRLTLRHFAKDTRRAHFSTSQNK